MRVVSALRQRWHRHRETAAPRALFRQGVFWSVALLACLVLAATAYHLDRIPGQLRNQAHALLDQRPWLRELVVVDGRTVYLRGEVDSGAGLGDVQQRLADIPGVERVVDVVQKTPHPAPFFRVSGNDEALELSGNLAGESLEIVVDDIRQTFTDATVTDRIVIDDRLGRPLWTHGIGRSLAGLRELPQFELHGWQDKLVLDGIVTTDDHGRRIGYGFPVHLVESIEVVNRLRAQPAAGRPTLSLVSDWSGTRLEARVADSQTAAMLDSEATGAFGEQAINLHIDIDGATTDSDDLAVLTRLFPLLSIVRDLRLESSGDGYVVWGRVDDPLQLGRIRAAADRLGLTRSLRNEIVISRSDEPATLSVFTDRHAVTLTGVLPTFRSKQAIIESLQRSTGVSEVRDLVSIEPNVRYSEWLEQWPELLAVLDVDALGVTIADRHVLLTGTVESDSDRALVEAELVRLFPDRERLNWITVSTPRGES